MTLHIVVDELATSGDFRRLRYQYPNMGVKISGWELEKDEKMHELTLEQRYQKLKKVVEQSTCVDLIYCEEDYNFERLVQDGLVRPMKSLLKKEGMDFEKLNPGIREYFEKTGDYYGLSTSYQTEALFYNKKIFQELGISFPKDNMTWDQVFQLAAQVTSKKHYGLTPSSYIYTTPMSEYIRRYLRQKRIKIRDAVQNKARVQTPEWENAYEKFAQMVKKNIIPLCTYDIDNNFLEPFFVGKAAMTIGNYEIIKLLEKSQKIEWDVVTAPSHPEYPQQVHFFKPTRIYCISNKANNPSMVAKYIAFLNNEKVSELTNRYDLLNLSGYLSAHSKKSWNTKAFTDVKPVLFARSPELNVMRNPADIEKNPYISTLLFGQKAFEDVLKGTDIKQALKDFEEKANKFLTHYSGYKNIDF